MRTLAVLFLLASMTLPAFASKHVTVAQLEQTITAARGKSDAEVGQQISDLELTERLSTTTLARLQTNSPGPKTSQELTILADQSAFLLPPAAEIPQIPLPDLAAQRKMMAMVVDYVSKTIHQLPNFYATRVTTHFEETPQLQTGTNSTPYRPLHETNAFDVTVLYRDGTEVVDRGRSKPKATEPQEKGLRDWGVFGPILSTVFLDAAKSDLTWGHWEQTPAGTQAVFRYAVPLEKSHYRVNYCCVPGNDPRDPSQWAPLDRIVGYRGEIAVDPHLGSILRLTVQAELRPSDPISRADIMVEYGPVNIGDQSYICATRSVALSSVLSGSNFTVGDHGYIGSVAPNPPQKLLNDVAFEQYHMFRSSSRILTGDEAKDRDEPPAAPPASPVPSEQTKALPPSQPTETAEDQSSAPGSDSPAASAQKRTAEQEAALTPTLATNAAPEAPALLTNEAPLFKSTTHEVLVDAVATKSDGEPVLGLGKQDFEIRENGKPQAIDFFEEHTKSGGIPSAPPAMPPMPAGSRTNIPPAPESDAVNVLLLDTLNAEPQQQSYVHQQVMNFLQQMQPGTRVAIFILGSQLRFVQGFTADTSVLIAALNDKRYGMKVQKDHSARSRSDEADNAANIAQMQVMQVSPMAIAAIRKAQADSRAFNSSARVSMTFEALNYLGRYLAGVPGRKNLIWFASSFPVIIFPTGEQRETIKKNTRVPGYLDKVRTTADLFTISRIALYPISAEGMMSEHVTEAGVAGEGPEGLAAHAGSQGGDSPLSAYSAGAAGRADTINAMQQLAASTGGKAYYNTNDLNAAMRRAINDGSNYYTIGYAPTETKMDGSYRQIEVKLAKGKYKLAYRHGYNADDSPMQETSSGIEALAPLLQSGMPDATGILYGVHVGRSAIQPATDTRRAGQNEKLKAPLTRFDVDLIVRSQDVVLRSEPKGDRSGEILLGLRAYDRDGHAVNWEGDRETLDLTPDQYRAIQAKGLPVHLEIDLPADVEVHLATAVYDPNSGKAGTLEIPVNASVSQSKTSSTASKTN